MSKVYLVLGIVDYESASPVRVFATKDGADEFVKQWVEHHQRKPEPPDVIEDTPENDALHDRWWKSFERWRKRCPGGGSVSGFDGLQVHDLKVYP